MSSDQNRGFEFPEDSESDSSPGEIDESEANAFAAQLVQETDEKYQTSKENQHALLDAVAEEDGAPLLETKTTIYGHTVPVSGRLTGAFIERVESLDAEAKRRAEGDGDQSVSDIVRELAEIIDDLIDDPELTADGVYEQYRREGVGPVRTLLDEVMEALQKEEERVRGDADGFRSQ